MSEQRTVTDAATGVEMAMDDALRMDPETHKKLRAERKAKFARVLQRGVTHDRLHVDLPPTLHGEWVANDRIAILEKESLGFRVDTEFAAKMAQFQGDGKGVVGDAIFMIQDMEDHEICEEIRKENYEAMNGKPGQVVKEQLEERSFTTAVKGQAMPVIEESTQRSARKAELEEALKRNNATPAGPPTLTSPPQPKTAGTIIR